jgi:hypothetical protein
MNTVWSVLGTLTLFVATTIALSAHNFKKGKLEGCQKMLDVVALDPENKVSCVYDDNNKLTLHVHNVPSDTTDSISIED